MRKIVAFLLMMLIAVVCSNSTYAYDPATKSSKQRYNERVMGSLAEKLRAAMVYNSTHANKKYYIKDEKNARFFYSFFTSDNASDLIDEGYKNMKMSREYDWVVNKYILELREKYLPEKYKDYQIYFMTGGLFYTPDISKSSRYEQRLDWKNLRSVSFDNIQATKPEVPYATDAAKEQAVRSEFSKKINYAIYDTVLKENNAGIVIDDKTIIIYKWLLFDFDIKDETLESYLKDYTLNWKAMLKAAPIQPVLFMSDGFFYKKKTPELADLEAFLESDGTYSDLVSADNMADQRNKLYKDIANAFIYFYQKDKQLIPDDFCSRADTAKETILGVLASSYKQAPTGNWSNISFKNTVLFTKINWETRKCIIDYLLNKHNCNDAKGWGLQTNACENMLVDVIESTKGEDQKKLLEYFNDPVNYNKLCKNVDDYGGDDNFTAIIYSFVRLAALNNYGDFTGKSPIRNTLFDFYHMVKPQSAFTFQKSLIETSVDSFSLQFTFSESQSILIGGAVASTTISGSTTEYTCTPFTPVNFIYSDDLGVAVQKPDGSTPIPGEIVVVPALYLHWLIDKDMKTQWIKAASTALMVYGLIDGVTEFIAAESIIARLWTGAGALSGMVGLASSSPDVKAYVKEQWGETGMDVLAVINTVGTWHGRIGLGKSALDYIGAKLKQQAFRAALNEMTHSQRLKKIFIDQNNALNAAAFDKGMGLLKGVAMDAAGTTAGDLVYESQNERIFRRIDTLNLASLKNALVPFEEEKRKKFIADFSKASNHSLKKINEDLSLLDYWKEHGEVIKKRAYPNVGHKDWEATKSAITSGDDLIAKKVLLYIENAKAPSQSEVALAVAYSPDLAEDAVATAYNIKNFDVTKLEKELQEPLKYLTFIKEDFEKGGELYQTLYTNVPMRKIQNAGIPGAHAEVLAVNEIVRRLKKANKFHSIEDLGKIHVLVKGIPAYGNMCRCPHCFHILYDAIMIGNK